MKNTSCSTLTKHFNISYFFSLFPDQEVRANISLWLFRRYSVCYYSQQYWVTSQISSLPSARRGRSFRVSQGSSSSHVCVSLCISFRQLYFNFLHTKLNSFDESKVRPAVVFLHATSIDFYCDPFESLSYFMKLYFDPTNVVKSEKKIHENIHLGAWL